VAYNFVVAFTVNDLQDFLRLLREQPEWLDEVRRVVLTDELLALPRELAEAQLRTDARFAELAEAIQRLGLRFEEAQRRNEEQLAELRRQTDARFASWPRPSGATKSNWLSFEPNRRALRRAGRGDPATDAAL
jgi:hypothetical protein